MSSETIEDLWDAFYLGDRETLAAQRCPKCGGTLQWSPYINAEPRSYLGNMRHRMGLSVYCLGACNYMLAHWDGVAPEWVLKIENWDAFNLGLRSGDIP